MERREVLKRLIQSSLALWVPRSRECHGATMPSGVELLIENVAPGYDANSLGEEYLRRFPKCRNRVLLLKDIFGSGRAPTRSWGRSVDARIAAEFLRGQIARDFDRDATLRIGGWLYAQTELKLCALRSMSQFEEQATSCT